jgi:8-oxo-dGTP pyrophosphatase MutT (NUDIX family)
MTYRVRAGGRWIEVPVARLGGEALVVANVAALVVPERRSRTIVLQRRDKEGEAVRGRLEVPCGRWRAGETAAEAVRREVLEETGLEVSEVLGGPPLTVRADPERPFEVLDPVAVTVGVGGAYPALHLAFTCVASGTPVAQPGETADPRWYEPEEVRELLTEPSRFTGPTLGVLTRWLAGR